MEWYEDLNFDDNPFDTNPKAFADKLVGMDEVLDEIFYRVPSGSLVFIEAKTGHGKTSLLWNIIQKYRGRGKVVYLDCEKLEAGLNIENVLQRRQGMVGSILGKMPSDMILLLDNVSELSKRNAERIKFFFDQGYLLSVVFTGTSFSEAQFSQSLKERIGNRIIRLKDLDEFQGVSLIRNRIGDSTLITDELIQDVFRLSQKNPLDLIQNCEKLFRHAVESKEQPLTKKHLRLIEG